MHKPWRPEEDSKYNPWWIILPKLKALKAGKRASAYSQCDLARITNGNLKLAFLSLYPMEKGWVTGRKGRLKSLAINTKKYFGDTQINLYISKFLNYIFDKPTFLLGRDKKGRLALRDIIQSIFMKIPFSRVNFIQSNRYDYYVELLEERKYLYKRNNKLTSSDLFIPWIRRNNSKRIKLLQQNPRGLEATGTYTIAKNGEHVKHIIDDEKIAFVLTMEGANIFNTNNKSEDIKKRISEVKGWDESLFFITFTHHFYNHLAGHAHSIPDIGNLLLDQSEGLYSGFTEKGLEIARYFLSINDKGEYKPDELGRRILIDVKHMNAKSRKEYYQKIAIPSLASEKPIPIIASHVAFSGRKSLKELIENMKDEKDGDFTVRDGHQFNNWNINLCDEDVINIYKSNGLIGINLDQRVLGISEEDKNNEDSHANYVWQNVKAMMQVAINSADNEVDSRSDVANMFCLGTDFDGFIDPLNKYPTVLEFETLSNDLIKVIKKDPDIKKIIDNADVTEFVDKICFKNAFDFVVRNF